MDIPHIRAEHVIRDPVHGYIHLTDLEYELIQMPEFIRLHRVRQNSTAFLTYPGALHSRLEHVIGSLFMGSKIITHLLGNLHKDDFKELFPKIESTDIIIRVVRLACLFHDIGHGPFSHAGEEIMREAMGEKSDEVAEAKKLFDVSETEDLPIHEYYSYKIINNGEIRETIEADSPGMAVACSSLIVKNPSGDIARENPMGFSILKKIISGQLDADRMDYLLRDALMAGVTYGQIDAERVITNMSIQKDGMGKYELAIHHRALGAVEDMLDSRFKMYKWLYQHHMVVTTDALIQLAVKDLVKKDMIEPKIFHWKEFSNLRSTDDYILDVLAEHWKNNQEIFYKYRGLWDRRYLPVSLLKRSGDWDRFINRAAEITKRKQPRIVLEKKIKNYPQDILSMKLLEALAESPNPIKKAEIMIISRGRAPYQPLTLDDNIWLFDGKDEMQELMSQSAYIKCINEEWTSFPGVYLPCLIPNIRKNKFSDDMKNEIMDMLIRVIFEKSRI